MCRTRTQPPGLRVLLWTCSIVLLAQSLAPPGYMPGSLADGWPVVLCPEGLPTGFLGAPSRGHHHQQGASGAAAPGSAGDGDLVGHSSSDAQSYCPLGSALGHPALTTTPVEVEDALPSVLTFNTAVPDAVKPSRFFRYRPRGPPRLIV